MQTEGQDDFLKSTELTDAEVWELANDPEAQALYSQGLRRRRVLAEARGRDGIVDFQGGSESYKIRNE
jgi:hypothetical protein